MTSPRLAELTTLRVGGPAERLVAPETTEGLVAELRDLWRRGEDWLLLGGGSNLLVGDGEVSGTVVRVVTRGVRFAEPAPGPAGERTVLVSAAAGEQWDALVAETVQRGLTGIEALSGIPGSVGAAPVQNIGAYGQELSDVLVDVTFLDYLADAPVTLTAAELELGYRRSALKGGRLGAVLEVTLALSAGRAPVRYAQLAAALGVEPGSDVEPARIRESVLTLRRSKGMVLDPADPDSVSAGSFFTNPIVSEAFARQLPDDAPRFPVAASPEPADVVIPLDEAGTVGETLHEGLRDPREREVKLSAAWLIERSGIARGFRLPGSRAAVSSKHTLALVNTGDATAEEIAQLARYLQSRVAAEFGVLLQPEPVRVGVDL